MGYPQSVVHDKLKNMLNWHRLFGIGLIDLFTGTNYTVELERDLSLKQQFLDVIIIEQTEGELPTHLPEGLEPLAKHNLLTYKSLRESLDSWAIDELIGHYVNYRKQISEELLPVEDFRLYAVCTRFPHKLAKEIELREQQAGVYDVQWSVHQIRVLVLNQFTNSETNAFWQLFSANVEKVQFGRAKYLFRRHQVSSFINELFRYYHVEGVNMPYTVKDYVRDVTKSHLHELTIEERLEGLSSEQILQKIPPEQRLQGLSSEQKMLLLKLLSETTAQKQ